MYNILLLRDESIAFINQSDPNWSAEALLLHAEA